jgi:hypothetical protein
MAAALKSAGSTRRRFPQGKRPSSQQPESPPENLCISTHNPIPVLPWRPFWTAVGNLRDLKFRDVVALKRTANWLLSALAAALTDRWGSCVLANQPQTASCIGFSECRSVEKRGREVTMACWVDRAGMALRRNAMCKKWALVRMAHPRLEKPSATTRPLSTPFCYLAFQQWVDDIAYSIGTGIGIVQSI